MEKFSLLQLLILVEFLVSSILGIHLFISRERSPGKLLGLYTLTIGITAAEPLLIQIAPARSAIEAIIAVCSFLLGPLLYLYTRYRVVESGWRRRDIIHGLPALLVLMLIILAPAPSQAVASETTPPDEVLFYGLFVLQLLGYTIGAYVTASKHRPHKAKRMRGEMQHAFVMALIIASLVLFVYSVITSLIPMNKHMLIVSIQLLLGIVIIVIALLNAESLEKHVKEHRP